MKKDLDKLVHAVGRAVQAVIVEVLFYSVERTGDIGTLTVTLADGSKFSLACGGDGGISVTRSRGAKGNAPGFTTEHRAISGLSGVLQEVTPTEGSLLLVIGGQKLLLMNQDDELLVTVDCKALPQQIFRR